MNLLTFGAKVLHIGRMFGRTIIAMNLQFSPFDPQRMGLVDALYHFYHFMTKISKLACFLSYDKDAKFSANFTEILTSNLGPFMAVIVKILK